MVRLRVSLSAWKVKTSVVVVVQTVFISLIRKTCKSIVVTVVV
nr:MAG TPA: hypothetical protein [Caudoviricetes sp.]